MKFKLKKIENNDTVKVYDIQVKNTENFTIGKNKIVVHNCFLMNVSDSIQGLINHTAETRWLSILGGGCGAHWPSVRGVTDKSPGTIPFIHTMDSDMDAYMQGKMRRGSYAAYQNISHPDIVEFLNLRIPTGDTSRKCHSKGFHNAINITDDFMEAVLLNKTWDLVQPHNGEITETLDARDLWQQILETRYRTGEPYLCFIDTANKYLPTRQKDIGLKIHGSNLCVAPETEILTDTGYHNISSLVGKTVNVWNGDEFSETIIVKTGENQKLITINFTDGHTITCTEYHKFYITGNIEIRAKDLKIGDTLDSYYLPYNDEKITISVTDISDNNRYDDTYCFNEPKKHKGVFNGILTGQCSEIFLPTSDERTAVCCLSSLNMETFDEWRGTRLVRDLIYMLNFVLNAFIENAPDAISKARYSAMKERAVGLGMMGFHSYLQQKGVPFESERAREINKEVFEYVHNETVEATKELGIIFGECPDFITELVFSLDDGSYIVMNSSDELPPNNGNLKRAFQFEIGHKINGKTIIDIQGKHDNTGWHNSNLTALAPNASSGILMGTSPSIEPSNSNAYIHETRAGAWPVKNVYLERLLEEKGRNTQDVWNTIIGSKGSVQHLEFLTEYEKMIFKTAFELDQHWVVKHAADRQPFITQGQSVNLFFPARVDKSYFNSVHIEAWKQGLKSLYYTRTLRHNKMDNVSEKVERNALKSIEDDIDDGSCKACEG